MNLDKMLNLCWMLDLTIFQWANTFKIIRSPSFLRKNSSLIWLFHFHFGIWRVHLDGANIVGAKIGNLDIVCIWGLCWLFLRNICRLIEEIPLLRSENGLLTKSSHIIKLVRLDRSFTRYIWRNSFMISSPVATPMGTYHLLFAFSANFILVSIFPHHINIKTKIFWGLGALFGRRRME